MPKLKTKSGAKKRFKITGTWQGGLRPKDKRHGMIKRTNKQIRAPPGRPSSSKQYATTSRRFLAKRLS